MPNIPTGIGLTLRLPTGVQDCSAGCYEERSGLRGLGNLKYLLCIPDIAFMYVGPELSEDLEPGITGWFVRVNPFDFAPEARRFDTRTPPVVAAYAARAWMRPVREVGVAEIQHHVQEISHHVIKKVREWGWKWQARWKLMQREFHSIRVGDRSAEIEKKMFKREVIVSARAEVVRFVPHFFTTHEGIAISLGVLHKSL